MAIFGRITARQRLRRATRQSLAIPAFNSPIDCTPWVTGGLWPAELTTDHHETSRLARYLKADLERIARSANDQLRLVLYAGLADAARRAEETRIIADARARAVRRVESTIRQLSAVERVARGAPEAIVETDLGITQVMPAVRAAAPADGPRLDDTQVMPTVDEARTVARHRAPDAAVSPPQNTTAAEESAAGRLDRLLAFVVRQEPRLNWAVADFADGTTVVVTDLAHGWIPPGVALPAGVRLLTPGRRSGTADSMVRAATRAATYAPGDSLRRSVEYSRIEASGQPRALPPVEDLTGLLCAATNGRDGLPRMVHAMAGHVAAGGRIVDQEVDVLRVQLDTARYQLMVQYPNVDPGLVLNCLLLASTEAFVTGDRVSANYHLTWFHGLAASPA